MDQVRKKVNQYHQMSVLSKILLAGILLFIAYCAGAFLLNNVYPEYTDTVKPFLLFWTVLSIQSCVFSVIILKKVRPGFLYAVAVSPFNIAFLVYSVLG